MQLLLFIGKVTLKLLDWLEAIVIKREALPAAQPITTINLTPDQVEQINVAEEVAKIQKMRFEPIPVITPEPNKVKIVSWVDLPEVLEVPEISGVSHTPIVAETLEVSEIPEILETVEALPAAAPPTLTRREIVEGLLDEAWQQGITSYAAMMKYIGEQTGTPCSKKVISAWKKARQLTTSEPVAA